MRIRYNKSDMENTLTKYESKGKCIGEFVDDCPVIYSVRREVSQTEIQKLVEKNKLKIKDFRTKISGSHSGQNNTSDIISPETHKKDQINERERNSYNSAYNS